MVRIKDIALKANVSTATVSYALNGNGTINPEMRERVLKVAKEMNYQTNHIAKSLKIKKTRTIGIVVEDLTSFNSSEIMDGIYEYAELNDFSILFTNMRVVKRLGNQYANIELCAKLTPNVIKEVLNKQVDGLIFIGVHPRDVTGMILEETLPIVYTYCYTSGETDYSVNYDDFYAAYEAMKYLISFGHKKIGVISGLINSDPSRERFNGFYQALADHQLQFNPSWIKTGDWEFHSGFEMANELLAVEDHPTAILAMNDNMAAGAIDACLERGLILPQDISIIGIDDREFSSYIKPKLTTMKLPLHEMGVESMKTMIDILNKEGQEARIKKLNCSLVIRNSVDKLK
jgi:LacI family transcriptional regulator